MTIPMIIGAITIIFCIWFISTYNGLIKLRNMVKNSWSQIDVQLKMRFDLIPNLVETVKGYAAHEKEVFENISKARQGVQNAKNVDSRINAETGLENAMKSLFAVAEAYPALRANENFLQLQNQLSEVEKKIAFARQFYNDVVMKYNTKIQVFPNNIIAGMLGFSINSFFETENAAEKNNIAVKF